MEETLMMDDEELYKHIENLKEEVDENYRERDLTGYAEQQGKLQQAIEEAESRGYKTLEDLKKSI